MLQFSRWKTILVWLAVFISVVVALPNLFSERQLARFPSWLPHHKAVLGLDLQGGSRISLKIERDEIVAARLQATINDVARRLRDAKIATSDLSGTVQTITLHLADAGQMQAATDALKPLTDSIGTSSTGGAIREAAVTSGNDGLITVALTNDGINFRVSAAVDQSIDVVENRVKQVGRREPLIEKQGIDRLIVEVPGLTDPQRLKTLLNQPAKLTFNMLDTSMPVQTAIDTQPPANSEVLYSQDDPPESYLVVKRPVASDQSIVGAEAILDPATKQNVVTFQLDDKATQAFAQATAKNVGKPYVAVLDDQVISAPLIKQPITDGKGMLAGNFSPEGAADLLILLRSGSLPATLTVVEERTIEPGLGADSVKASVIAGIVGALAVVGFMVFFYGSLGGFATAALVFNIILIMAVLSFFQATLTLPGIAGIIFTMGLAVDSNVLIYERIREKLKAGTPFVQACESGFARAYTTIIDANVTTLIAAAILFSMGSGPVRGFAVTLGIGIIASLFTAFTLTRWLIATWIKRRRPKHLPKGVRTAMFDGAHIRFMGIRRYTFTVSAVLSLIAMVGFFSVGMHLGVDFTGGSLIEVRAKQGKVDIPDIKTRLSQLNIGDVQARPINNATGALIRLQSQDGGENAEQSAVTLVRGELQDAYEFRRVEVVGPAISGQLTRAGTFGVLASLAAIFIYIWVRFAWQYALGAIIATLHDIILTFGLFVVTGIEFNLTSIAAVLTIIGYSLNDTVVVYDRTRENLRHYKQMPLPILIDASINQTLSRTVLTAATTLLALLALSIFGGEVIRSFTFVMFFGVAVGTFSSIYIAAPVLIAFKLRPKGVSPDPAPDLPPAGKAVA
ncbi:protein translocase subunit SecDF [Rhizobium sp. HT1-10]|uniref:protein translocase subunit SecDF n=1 Tax=Rhizobium sp. HT1-10 TaxID=3111638 RepID=UPI003C16526B